MGKWYAFIGHVKSHDDQSPIFIANSFNAVTSFDQVINHFLQTSLKYLWSTRESQNGDVHHIVALPSHLLDAEVREKRIRDDLEAVYESKPGGPVGHDRQEVYDLFKNRYTEHELAKGVQELEDDGLIFHTIDADHHKSTKFNPGTT